MEEACQDLKAQAGMAYVTSYIPLEKTYLCGLFNCSNGDWRGGGTYRGSTDLPALSNKKDRFIGKMYVVKVMF